MFLPVKLMDNELFSSLGFFEVKTHTSIVPKGKNKLSSSIVGISPLQYMTSMLKFHLLALKVGGATKQVE